MFPRSNLSFNVGLLPVSLLFPRSTDLAAVRHRLQTEACDRIIYVVDAGQGDHFDKVFYTARKLGWLP